MEKYYKVFWMHRDWVINVIINEYNYNILINNEDFSITVRDFYRYGHDEIFNAAMFSFELIEEDIIIVQKYHKNTNETIVLDLVNVIKLEKLH